MKIKETAVPANAVAATGGHVKPIGPDDTPPGVIASQRKKKKKRMYEIMRRMIGKA